MCIVISNIWIGYIFFLLSVCMCVYQLCFCIGGQMHECEWVMCMLLHAHGYSQKKKLLKSQWIKVWMYYCILSIHKHNLQMWECIGNVFKWTWNSFAHFTCTTGAITLAFIYTSLVSRYWQFFKQFHLWSCETNVYKKQIISTFNSFVPICGPNYCPVSKCELNSFIINHWIE